MFAPAPVKWRTGAVGTGVGHKSPHFELTVGCNAAVGRYLHCECLSGKDQVCCSTMSCYKMKS